MSDEIRYRRGTPDDTEAICALLGETFPAAAKSRPEILRWQYWDNPFGQTESAIAETDDGIIGHFMTFAVPGLVDGRRHVAGMGGDAATLPSARGRGVFSTLTDQAWSRFIAANDAAFVYMAPNPISFGVCARTGMTPVAQLPAWIRPVDPRVLTDRAPIPRAVAQGLLDVGFRRRRGHGLSCSVDAELPDDIGPLCAHEASQVLWGIDPSPGWLRWRFADRPGDDYRVVSVRRGGELRALAVCRDEEREEGPFTLVLELLQMDREAGAEALGTVVDLAEGALAVALIGSPEATPRRRGHDPVTAAAAHAGFRRLPPRLAPRPLHFGVVPGRGLPDPTGIRWRTQWSFLDHL